MLSCCRSVVLNIFIAADWSTFGIITVPQGACVESSFHQVYVFNIMLSSVKVIDMKSRLNISSAAWCQLINGPAPARGQGSGDYCHR